MTGGKPFKIQILVADGRPDGLRLVEKSNWIGQGICVHEAGTRGPRKRERSFLRSGVYLLVGQDGDPLPKLYVGEAEEVKTRLDRHYEDKDFWQQAIVFTTKGTPLNKAEVKYLEASLLKLARRYGRSKLQNTNKPRLPGLSEADQAEMEGYLDELLSLLPVLGCTVLRTRRSAIQRPRSLPCGPIGLQSGGLRNEHGIHGPRRVTRPGIDRAFHEGESVWVLPPATRTHQRRGVGEGRPTIIASQGTGPSVRRPPPRPSVSVATPTVSLNGRTSPVPL